MYMLSFGVRQFVVWTLCLCVLGCGDSVSRTETKSRLPGWYLEKTTAKTVHITFVDAKGQELSWEGQFFDDSPKGTLLNPIRSGQDNGLFRWARPGCGTLSFVLTETELKCITCVDPGQFIAYTATCPLDQQRLPVQGWHVKGLKRPQRSG
jgi:hypothetical protein